MHQSLLKPLFSGGIWGPQCAISETTAKKPPKDGTHRSNCEREFSANTSRLPPAFRSGSELGRCLPYNLSTWGRLGEFITVFTAICSSLPPLSLEPVKERLMASDPKSLPRRSSRCSLRAQFPEAPRPQKPSPSTCSASPSCAPGPCGLRADPSGLGSVMLGEGPRTSPSVRHWRSAPPRWMTNLNRANQNVKGTFDKYTIRSKCANEIKSSESHYEG